MSFLLTSKHKFLVSTSEYVCMYLNVCVWVCYKTMYVYIFMNGNGVCGDSILWNTYVMPVTGKMRTNFHIERQTKPTTTLYNTK